MRFFILSLALLAACRHSEDSTVKEFTPLPKMEGGAAVRPKRDALPPARDGFSFEGTGRTLPDGFVSPEMLQAYPKLLSQVGGYFPGNCAETPYRGFYFMRELPLSWRAETQRYQLDDIAFKRLRDKDLKSLMNPCPQGRALKHASCFFLFA